MQPEEIDPSVVAALQGAVARRATAEKVSSVFKECGVKVNIEDGYYTVSPEDAPVVNRNRDMLVRSLKFLGTVGELKTTRSKPAPTNSVAVTLFAAGCIMVFGIAGASYIDPGLIGYVIIGTVACTGVAIFLISMASGEAPSLKSDPKAAHTNAQLASQKDASSFRFSPEAARMFAAGKSLDYQRSTNEAVEDIRDELSE